MRFYKFYLGVFLISLVSLGYGETKIIFEYDFKNLSKEKSIFLANVNADLEYNIIHYKNKECTSCECLYGAMKDSNANYSICIKTDTTNGGKAVNINVIDVSKSVIFAQNTNIKSTDLFDLETIKWMVEINKQSDS